jgi:RNA polymerase sigma-70 factor (ECF subfamily)
MHLPHPALRHQPFAAQSALQILSKASSSRRQVNLKHWCACTDLTLSKAVAMTPDRFKTELIGLLPRLRRFALSLTRSGPDADDLLQDACAAALQKWEQYDPAQPLDRWMFRIVRNMWISEIRKRKTRLGEGQIPAEEAAELRTEDTAADDLTARQVRGKVENLDQDLAQPLLLVCAEGYSYREVAELLSIPIGTVMSRIHRARKLLISSLSEVEQVAK